MPDQARVWTDAHLQEMELHLRSIYRQAQSELTEKWNKYMARGQVRLDNLYSAYQSAPDEQKAAMLARYQDAMMAYTLRNQWYRNMVDSVAVQLAHVNEIAINYVNGQMPAIYAINYNYVDPDALLIKSSWDIVDEHMVQNLTKRSLPKKTLNYAKDISWNEERINASVLQGVLQGESMNKIADRLLPIVDNNRNAAIRTARTMVTGAENEGRRDRYLEYEEEGLVINKVWIATPDGRTRAWHMDMDGQEVGADEPFIDGHGNELEYPGDPMAEPETVYNCRCSMRSHILGFRDSKGKIHSIKDYRAGVTTLHSTQMARERGRRGQ